MRALILWAVVFIAIALPAIREAAAGLPVSQLRGTVRGGQIFLTWKETETPEGTTFNVYVSDRPIDDVAKARCVGHHVERHSARDWWEDPASFVKDGPRAEAVGFLLEPGGRRLDPQDGLFVHTVRKGTRRDLFFAVTSTDPAGNEERTLVRGVNAMRQGITAVPGDVRPIWQRGGRPPEPGAGKAKGLWLNLHAKGGVVPDMEYLVFGDETMGWREGLPLKFSVRVQEDEVVVRPTDRAWINRPHLEASDGGMLAIWTFWYGYNSNIYDRSRMGEGTPTNYTERRNLWILNWVRNYYQPDPNRWYCSGSSMGGCGTISFGLRHPELFAAVHAHVPIVSYTYLGMGSAHRLEPSCWVGPIPSDLRTNERIPLLDRMNGTKFVTEASGDLPFVFLINGRQDGSIPWENNPPFYRALNDAHQGFAAFWDNGEHGTCGKNAPDDVKGWIGRMRRYRLDQSFPAFANTSSDRNPGNGQPDDGDVIGWMNRGMDWKDIEDQREHYAITILADYPGIEYPIETDVTLRRLQRFKPQPGERVNIRMGGAPPRSVEVDAAGRITVSRIIIPSREGVRVDIRPWSNGDSSS